MKMYIKESYVHFLPLRQDLEGPTRWVGCNGEGCGYERNQDQSNYDSGLDSENGKLLRMFKVNGEQICEECLECWKLEIHLALMEDDEED